MEYIVKPFKTDSLVAVSTDKEPDKTVDFMIIQTFKHGKDYVRIILNQSKRRGQ